MSTSNKCWRCFDSEAVGILLVVHSPSTALLFIACGLSLLTSCRTTKLLPGFTATPGLEAEISAIQAAGVHKRPGVPIVDVHTHLFNSRYLPIGGIIVSREDDLITFPHQLLGLIGTGYWIRSHEIEQLGSLLQLATPTDDQQPHAPLPTPAAVQALAEKRVAEFRAGNRWLRLNSDEHLIMLERQKILRACLIQSLWFKLPDPTAKHGARSSAELKLLQDMEAAGLMEPLTSNNEPPSVVPHQRTHRSLYDLAVSAVRRHPLTALTADNTRVITERGLDHLLRNIEHLNGFAEHPDPAFIESRSKRFLPHRSKIETVYWFALHLVAGEKDLVAAMAGPENGGVDFYSHLMMNMAPSFHTKQPDTLTYDFQHEQLRRAQHVDELAQGRCVHFVAWNPFDSKDDHESAEPRALRIIKEGIATGAVGVKFYPPMGYRPACNEREGFPAAPSASKNPRALEQWRGRYEGKNWTPAALDKLNMRLFRWCADHDIPVFTHCNHSEIRADGGNSPNYGALAHPMYWEPVLRELPQLRLCLGHAGGPEYWVGVTKSSSFERKVDFTDWGFKVQELCMAYPNVYCEAAMHFPLGNPAIAARFATRITQIASMPCADGRHTMADKIMYGSDWYMPSMEPPETYLNAFISIYQTRSLSPYYTRFFNENALRYLHLSASTVTRINHSAFPL